MKTKYLVLAICVFSLLAVSVFAAQWPGGVSVDATDLGRFDDTNTESVDTDAGNITQVDLQANQSTMRWTAIFGNVTGDIKLGDADGDYIYNWTAIGRVVYASVDATPDWANLEDALYADVTGALAYLADDTDADSYDNTFSGDLTTDTLDSDMFTISSDYVDTYDSSQALTWRTFSLMDGGGTADDLVFAAEVQDGGDSYKGSVVDYQMLLPEDGTQGDTTLTTYNLWVELV